MAQAPYSQPQQIQFRGPSKSDEYNKRIEDNYKDITVLYNRSRITGDDVRTGYARLAKDQGALTKTLNALLARVTQLESGQNVISFADSSQIDNSLFINTPFAIPSAVQCSYDVLHRVLTLPQVFTSSVSQLAYANSSGSVTLPSTLQMQVNGIDGTADSTGALIDTSSPLLAVSRTSGRIWERNVVVNSPNLSGAQVNLYIHVPTDLFSSDEANALVLHPYPSQGCDVLEVAYSTNPAISLNDADGYTPLNSNGIHAGETAAIGWIAPGGWSGDAALSCGPRIFYFDPLPVTALRITLQQKTFYQEGSQYIYPYGSSLLDLRLNKFAVTGSTMIRFDAPPGRTISKINSITPQIWNVPTAAFPSVISYQPIWETSYQSGVYTSSGSVPLSKRVWIKVTLNSTSAGGTPALSGLALDYS